METMHTLGLPLSNAHNKEQEPTYYTENDLEQEEIDRFNGTEREE